MDISLSDVGWVGGSLLALMVGAILFTQRAALAQSVRNLLSSWTQWTPPIERVEQAVDQRSTNAGQRIAITDNEVNEELNRLPEEVREIVRFYAKVEAVADLIVSERLSNKAKAIEAVFHCARSGKPGSVYDRANRALEPLVTKPRFPDLTPEQAKNREALGLSR